MYRVFYDGDGRLCYSLYAYKPGVWYYSIDSNIASLAGKRGEIECIPAKADNHGPVKVRGLHDFEYADGTVYYPLGDYGLCLDSHVAGSAGKNIVVIEESTVQ